MVQSYCRVTKGDLELNFCRHHGIEYSPALEEQGWRFHWDTEGISVLSQSHKIAV